MTVLSPSTDNVYESSQALMKAVNKQAEKQGYTIVKGRFKRNKKGVQSIVYLQWDHVKHHSL